MTLPDRPEPPLSDLPRSLQRLAPTLQGSLFEGWSRNPFFQPPVASRINLPRWRMFLLHCSIVLSVLALLALFPSEPWLVGIGVVFLVPVLSSLWVFVVCPLPPVPLITGVSPFSKDLWASGVHLRDIVQAVAVYAHHWGMADIVYLLSIPTCMALWIPLFVSLEPAVLREHILHEPTGWIQLGLVVAILGSLSGVLIGYRSAIRLYLQLGWLQKLLGQRDSRTRKAREVDLFSLPFVSHFYPLLPCMYWPLLNGLLLFVFPGPEHGYANGPAIAALGVLLILLGLPVLHFWGLPRKIDARVHWLLTTGEQEFNRRMRERFGDLI